MSPEDRRKEQKIKGKRLIIGISAGIHIDGAAPEEIALLEKNCQAAPEKLLLCL